MREDLLSLPGVEQAEIDGDSIAPAGVRIRLSAGVDPAAIGDEIRRVLSLHGLSQEADAVPDAVPDAAISDRVASSEPEKAEPVDRADEPREREPDVAEAPAPIEACLDWVSVAEGRDGIMVTAGGPTGEVVARAAGSSEPAIDQAVVSVVAELAGAASIPLIRSLDERELAGTPVVTIVFEDSGRQLVGSAVVEGGRAYAVGRAVWTALSAR
ncbi:MAG: hypothetical protein WBN43_13925 [Thiogranum sp.]